MLINLKQVSVAWEQSLTRVEQLNGHPLCHWVWHFLYEISLKLLLDFSFNHPANPLLSNTVKKKITLNVCHAVLFFHNADFVLCHLVNQQLNLMALGPKICPVGFSFKSSTQVPWHQPVKMLNTNKLIHLFNLSFCDVMQQWSLDNNYINTFHLEMFRKF